MLEELLDDQPYLKLHQIRQSELIAQRCAGIEEKIRRSASRSEAESIVSKACTGFEVECSSSIVRNALVLHLQNLLQQYWGTDGNA